MTDKRVETMSKGRISDAAANMLGALFGLDIAVPVTPPAATSVAPEQLMCLKCRGRGKFVGYSGKVLGPCFACEGTGLVRSAGVKLAVGDCEKCLGTGEWRPGRPCFTCHGTGKIAPVAETKAIDVSAIERAFAAALANQIAKPKLRLGEYKFSRAPDTGRNAGSLYVTSRDGGTYLGKVSGGQFHPTRECTAAQTAEIIEVASDPHKAAVAYGQRFGTCSCCGRTLTNGLSIDLGIGPICRGNFGWG